MTVQMNCHNKWLMAFPCYSTGICECHTKKGWLSGCKTDERVSYQELRYLAQAMSDVIQSLEIAFLGYSYPPRGQLCQTRLKDAAKRMAKAPIQLAESIGASPPEILRGGY